MCGICGFSGEGNLEDLSNMMAAMPYRGPDGDGQWHDDKGNYFGHVRLSIVDLVDGQQPLATSDGSIIVIFNGEIYNHRSLRIALENRGHTFKTNHSDTEVLLHGYREWGIELTTRLNGMWAFALFDRSNGKLWLSRDRFGKKPLYYAQRGDTFVFSSELHSLIAHPNIETTLDRLSLKKYFAHAYIPAPRSIITGVSKLPAGHNLIFDLQTRNISTSRYWRFELEPDRKWEEKTEEAEELLLDSLYRAVETRLEADVPVGIFLSGGIDSSAVAALSVAVNKGHVLRTFSIGFEEPSFDETVYSNSIAKLLGTKHTVETLSATKCHELLEPIYSRLDEPLADASLVPSFLVCKLAQRDVTVALGGDGSDELFAGYDPFKALRLANSYRKVVPNLFHQNFSRLLEKIPVSHEYMTFDFKVKKFLSGLSYDGTIQNSVWLAPLTPAELSNLFGESIDIEEIYSESIEAWEYPKTGNQIERTLQFYTELYLQNDILTKMDRAGMLNSLEVRSPFLDIDFVDVVRQMPTSFKFSGRQTKKILKKVLKPILPKEILDRPKSGFGMPVGKWFKDGHLEIDPTHFEGILDSGFVSHLYEDHMTNKSDKRSFLWAYHVLENWNRHIGVR